MVIGCQTCRGCPKGHVQAGDGVAFGEVMFGLDRLPELSPAPRAGLHAEGDVGAGVWRGLFRGAGVQKYRLCSGDRRHAERGRKFLLSINDDGMRIMRKEFAAAVMSGVALLSIVTASPSANAVRDENRSSGDTIRAKLWENSNGGHVFSVWGSSNCTSSYADKKTVMASMGTRGWNDVVSAIQDFHSCDIDLFKNDNHGGGGTGYRNYGETRTYVGASWNDQTSSFWVS